MDTKLTQYSLWCPEHAETLATDYRTDDQGLPTCCPLNSEHTNITGIAIIDVKDERIKKTRIIDTESLDPDIAVSATEDFKVGIVIGEDISSMDITFPFNINVIAAEYYVDYAAWNRDDYFEAWGIAAGDPYIGALTGAEATGQKIISVSPTVFANLRDGYYVEFEGQTIEKMYRVNSMDSVEGTITLEDALLEDIAAGKLIYPRRPFVPKKYVKFETLSRIGDLQAGSSDLNAGDILRIHFHHAVTSTVVDWIAFTLIYMF
jgi:hypothetical protein